METPVKISSLSFICFMLIAYRHASVSILGVLAPGRDFLFCNQAQHYNIGFLAQFTTV